MQKLGRLEDSLLVIKQIWEYLSDPQFSKEYAELLSRGEKTMLQFWIEASLFTYILAMETQLYFFLNLENTRKRWTLVVFISIPYLI